MKVQLGGGIRERKAIDDWLEKGITRVILGTAALRDPDLVREAARDYPGQIAVGIDARGGKVAVEGWAETSDMEALELARLFEDAGVAAIIYTDIDRDGVLSGINWEATIALAEAISIPVIASGGLPPWPISSGCCSPTRRSWKAPSPAARSMTGASTPRRRSGCWRRRHEPARLQSRSCRRNWLI